MTHNKQDQTLLLAVSRLLLCVLVSLWLQSLDDLNMAWFHHHRSVFITNGIGSFTVQNAFSFIHQL